MKGIIFHEFQEFMSQPVAKVDLRFLPPGSQIKPTTFLSRHLKKLIPAVRSGMWLTERPEIAGMRRRGLSAGTKMPGTA